MPNSFPRSDSLPTDDVSFMLRELAEQADTLFRRNERDRAGHAFRGDVADLSRLVASLARTLALKEAADAGKAVA